MSVEGQRMSKSLGNVIDPADAVGRSGVDPLGCILIKKCTYGGDGDFLVGARPGALQRRPREQPREPRQPHRGDGGESTAAGVSRPRKRPGGWPAWRRRRCRTTAARWTASLSKRARPAAFRIVDAANEYIAETEPWALARDRRTPRALSQVLFDVAEALASPRSCCCRSFPEVGGEILRRVGEATPADAIRLDDAAWRNDGERTIAKGENLWPRIEQRRL
jgi:methionyl-tRNA synthetase